MVIKEGVSNGWVGRLAKIEVVNKWLSVFRGATIGGCNIALYTC